MKLVAAFGLACVAFSASSKDIFTMTGTVSDGATETRTFGFKAAEDVFDAAKSDFLRHAFTSYDTDTEAANLDINFRGLPMGLAYAQDSTHLVFTVPSLGIREEFIGATRDESQKLYSDWMKKNGGSMLSRIMKKLVEVSPHDPVAGNPNSLMSQMVFNDFANGFGNPVSQVGGRPDENNTRNLIGIGARYSSLKTDGVTNNSFTIPLSYTVRSDIDPRRQLIFNLPVSYTEIEGTDSYSVGFGVAYRIPMNDEWTLTPAVNYGAGGSRDLGSLGQAVSASITSQYVFERDGFDIAVGNMVGMYQSLKLKANGYSYDAEIKNTVFRNGVMLLQPVTAFGRKMSVEYSLIDTRFTGTKLYIDQYNELGVTLGTNKSAASARSYYRAGATYLHAKETKGFTLNLGYWF